MNGAPHDTGIDEFRRPLNNETCIYCGAILTAETRTKEHVIGRRFVPRGSLANNWNLIANSCRDCNNAKSKLEDDISAITMQPPLVSGAALSDSALASEAERKARKSISSRTQKPVGESQEYFSITTPFMGAGMATFGIVGPAQIDESRIFSLARLQLAGFFYRLTYDGTARRGYFWRGEFLPLAIARRSDWGNRVQLGFMAAVQRWPHRLIGNTSNDFFRVAIRRHPGAECWSWALEWNKNLRVLGFFGDPVAAQAVANTLAPDPMKEFKTANETLRFRQEIPLAEKDDVLFYLPPSC